MQTTFFLKTYLESQAIELIFKAYTAWSETVFFFVVCKRRNVHVPQEQMEIWKYNVMNIVFFINIHRMYIG